MYRVVENIHSNCHLPTMWNLIDEEEEIVIAQGNDPHDLRKIARLANLELKRINAEEKRKNK